MTNIMSQFRLSNKPRRNGFDLSRKHCFTASAGQLLPVFVEEVLPGDKFEINLDSFTRTQPLNTAAFARMREYYDLFFVPYHILWSHFPTMITQVPNATVATSVNTPKQFRETPWMTVDELCSPIDNFEYCYNHTDLPTKADRFSLLDDGFIPCFSSSRKLLDMLGYGASDWYFGSKDSFMNVPVSPMRLLAYQKIYADFFRSQQWEDWKPYQSNMDFVPTNNPAGVDTYHYKIGDLFGVAGNSFTSATWNKDHPATMRYANLHKDLFTGVLPSSQYGQESVVQIHDLNGANFSFDGFDFFNAFGELNSVDQGQGNKISFDGSKIQAHGSGSSASLRNLQTDKNLIELSILALRKAEALQKYKEITQTNDYDYRSQIESHFGVKPDRGLSHQSTWLGGCTTNIGIDSVTNANLTDGNTLIKGKATSAGRGKWEYTSNDYGVIMCIYHCEPLIDYPCHLDKKACLISPEDYPIPEFDQIGMEVTSARFAPAARAIEYSNVGEGSQYPFYGYVPRYANFKTAVDYVTGDFNTIEKQWTIPYNLRLSEFQFAGSSGGFRFGFTYLSLKCTPDILDNIFTFGSPTSLNNQRYNSDAKTALPDQFLINSYWDTKVVRNLDRDGMPY